MRGCQGAGVGIEEVAWTDACVPRRRAQKGADPDGVPPPGALRADYLPSAFWMYSVVMNAL